MDNSDCTKMEQWTSALLPVQSGLCEGHVLIPWHTSAQERDIAWSVVSLGKKHFNIESAI